MIDNMENKYHDINQILKYKSSLMNLTKQIKIPKNLKYKKNNSITLDDIYHCNERDRWIYDDWQDVYPLTIGNTQLEKYIEKYIENKEKKNKRFSEKYTKKTTRKSTITNLTQKNYIRIGEECPICYDAIISKKQALLTDCCHAFHHECIQNYYNSDYNKFGCCPMCRSNDVGCYDLNKQQYCNGSSNKMDKYENFWNGINTLIPKKCYIFINDNHYEDIHNRGMDKNCIKCIQYRSHGTWKRRTLY